MARFTFDAHPGRSVTGIILTALGAAVLAGPATADDESPDDRPSRSIPVTTDDLYDAPTTSLDERIDPSKVGQTDPPPLPEQVMLPLPPTFRIAEDPRAVPVSEAHWERAHQAIEDGLAYLRSRQDDNGGWMTEAMIGPTDDPDRVAPVSVAVTAMAVKAFVQRDHDAVNEPHVQRAIAYILDHRRPDGSYVGGPLANYVTASVVSALAALDDHRLRTEVETGAKWLADSQWDQSEGLKPQDDWFGGAGYGGHGRPDLSNTQMMLDALYDAGYSPDEPAFQRATAFLSRAQNLSETNPAEWAGDDGGFIYTPAGGGESMASEYAGLGRDGRDVPEGAERSLRSYGSMTYAGFKSMLYAGMSPDDVRVRAAFDWIRRQFTFEKNPGLGQQGLYYYYHAMARALVVSQQDVITDETGRDHNWREELIDAVAERQADDGSWTNEADRWLESEPVLATIYSVLSLEETLKDAVHRGGERDPEGEAGDSGDRPSG